MNVSTKVMNVGVGSPVGQCTYTADSRRRSICRRGVRRYG